MVHLSDKIESKLISSSQSCIFFRHNENIILNWVDPPRQNIKNFLILSLDKAFKMVHPSIKLCQNLFLLDKVVTLRHNEN